MEQTECSKILALKIQTLGNYRNERIQQAKSRYCVTVLSLIKDSLIYNGYSTFFLEVLSKYYS